jgi:hypothetical protein
MYIACSSSSNSEAKTRSVRGTSLALMCAINLDCPSRVPTAPKMPDQMLSIGEHQQW